MGDTKKFLFNWVHNLIGLVGIVVGAGLALFIVLEIYDIITVLAVKSQTFVLSLILFGLIVIVSFIATRIDHNLDESKEPTQ